jgi:hypothetical protein
MREILSIFPLEILLRFHILSYFSTATTIRSSGKMLDNLTFLFKNVSTVSQKLANLRRYLL